MAPGTAIVAGSLAQRWGRGGHAWVFLQYLLGLRRLGWDVLFIDLLEPDMCRDLRGRACRVEESENLRYLEAVMDRFGLGDSFAVLTDGGRQVVGGSRSRLMERVENATFLINVMGFLQDDELLDAVPLKVFLDIDPGFGQMWWDLGLADVFRGHDAHVTIGENVGTDGCPIPSCGIDWITTPQPVVTDLWRPTDDARLAGAEGPFTSVVSWRGPFGPIEYGGRIYGLRVHEFRRFLDLPACTDVDFRLALEIDEADRRDRTRLQDSGWSLVDPAVVAADPWSYRRFIHGSAAEFMVAKNLYVATRSGWMSDRSLCYLASGRPVLAQDTGIASRYPVGKGLVLFRDLEEARAGVEEIRGNYGCHSRAAMDLAAGCFDSDGVLGRLLSRLGVA
jgi:hypothetical protein